VHEGALATGRYQVVRRIGAGGMGVVYEAEDRERGQRVALKTITNPDVEKVYQLKREFRGLADLSHPNLVALYDLVVDSDACFFTMELLDGDDLLAHLWDRPMDEPSSDWALAATADDIAPTPQIRDSRARSDTAPAPTPRSPTKVPCACDLEKLRLALPQLARGLHALHAAGKIHRDVKPPNIRVTSDGRVVLLDFGLVAELERRRGYESGSIVGTVAYMAPEQCAADSTLTAAADWYAVGVVIFQALTGKLPFEGSPARVVLDKQTKNAPRASDLATGVPEDLDELCTQLLDRDPAARPSGRALLARLGLEDERSLSGISKSKDGGFAGRDAELDRLDGALAHVAKGRASVAIVRAPSGMGKSALVSRFFERARASHEDMVVLRGRCFDREDVPYKAIDDLIDELSSWWLELPADEAKALLPTDACLLPALFPVLGRVPVIADAPRTRQVADPQELRTYAFAALRETLQRLTERRLIVFFLDDMQWVDRDTTTLLADLMRAPDPPRLLLLLSTRVDGSGAVQQLARRFDAELTSVDLGPLDPAVAMELALAQLGPGHEDTARRLVRESAGNPFFLMEMIRYLQGRSLDDIAGKGLEAMLTARIDDLGEQARHLAEVLAVAGEPVPQRALALASNLPSADLQRQLVHLRGQRFVRTSGARSDDTIEPYHDRIRETLLASLPAERRAKHHRALATALAARGSAEQLARHWYGAGELARAAPFARRAGDEARAKLDFDRAARCYQMALEGPAWNPDDQRSLRGELADSLAYAGRPREAADQFLAAADGADASSTLELRRRAAEQLLQSGYVSEGMDMTRTVLEGVGLSLPRTPLRGLMSMLARRAWLRIRGLGFKPRPITECSQADLTRVDVCEGTSFGLAMVDPFRSADFAARFLHLALKLGEPWRVSRAIALEADWLAAMMSSKRSHRLLSRLEVMTESFGNAQAKAQLLTTRGMLQLLLHNKWRSSYDVMTEAITLYRAVVGRAGFELDTVSMFCCFNLYYLGEINELSRRVPQMVQSASRTGNRYTAVTLRCGFPVAWLARLDPEDIEGEIVDALASWTSPSGQKQMQHMLALCSRVDLSLYRGDPESATPLLEADLKPIRRAMVDRAPIFDVLMRSTIARHAIGCAARAKPGSDRYRHGLAEARRIMRRFKRSQMPMGRACSIMIAGSVAELEGDTERAAAFYREALKAFENTETHLFAHAARNRLGVLLGGDEGAQLCATSHQGMARQGVREPGTMLDMLLPGPSR
jgi:eukaryotic-like serine/threonine-protein kinase